MNLFAATSFNIVMHAEEMFHFMGAKITNSMLLGWVTSVFLVSIFILAARKVKITAGGRSLSIIEVICDGVSGLANQVMGNRQAADKFAPFLITLFCFILFNNWFGLLPGVGSLKLGGEPLFRAWTADLTGTLALSICSIVIIQFYSFKELKIGGVFKHYFSNKPYNPINFFVGLLEVLGEFTRVASLALRLFGNVFAGEVLLLVLAAITSYAAPLATLPFILMEFFVGFIQAFVFTMLVIVYLTLAVAHHDEEHEQSLDHSPGNNLGTKKLATEGSPNGK